MDFNQIRQFAPQLLVIAKKHGISIIYVFGSSVRENCVHRNEVDFLVEMKAGVSLFGIGGIGHEAEKLLGIPVDVVPMSAISMVSDREFVNNIRKEAIAL